MTTGDELKADLLHEAEDDWLDIFQAIALVKVVEGGEGRLPLLRRAGPLLVDLVRDGSLVCGEPVADPPGAFDAWALEPSAAAEALRRYIDRALAGEVALVPWEPCSFALPAQVRSG
ncbi:hypothetical protein Acsp06_20310 [Actinomycetospora sp. NBRC 106375]|uniref:hypothetical protein n=1 Tax=Actinomycetospora sp. NBRC 106375 TaxID=3032207 RepID=UPI0024A15FD8|nr:hypothetical protein [Actinomycetospora sp. NBRC 106375]GLZ45846.1 hypothetical protein Acsp06_20310 [Actinomycetospora sp. NBRC 106375]